MMKRTITERVVALPGRAYDPDFHLAIEECGEGPAVVFVHGFPDLARGWQNQLSAVADLGYHAIAPNMR
jgi:pimeloyl-ACP methyl ester carboxylesterase